MQNGTFILNANAAYTTTIKNPLAIQQNNLQSKNLILFPNPASNRLSVNYSTNEPNTLQIKNMLGQTLIEKKFIGLVNENLDVSFLPNGSYFLTIIEKNQIKNKNFIINH